MKNKKGDDKMEHKDIWLVLGLTVILAVAVSLSTVGLTGNVIGIGKKNTNSAELTASCKFFDPASSNQRVVDILNGKSVALTNACLSFGSNYIPVATIVQVSKSLFTGDSCALPNMISLTREYQTTDIYGEDYKWSSVTKDFVRSRGRLIPVSMKDILVGQPLGGESYPQCTNIVTRNGPSGFSTGISQANRGVWCCKQE